MSFNTFGKLFRFTTWGESHGPAIGCVVDGCPPNIVLSEKDIQVELNKRRPGQSKFVTQRKEKDQVQILSGLFQGKTTGTPISMIIFNEDTKSRDYETIKDKFRPGHADFTYFMKYGNRDFRGGGRQSARETASRVAAGAIAKTVLKKLLGKKFSIVGGVIQIGPLMIDKNLWKDNEIRKNPFFCPDKETVPVWEQYLLDIRKAGSSCGAVIELRARGVPVYFLAFFLAAPLAAFRPSKIGEMVPFSHSAMAARHCATFSGFSAARSFDSPTSAARS